VLILKSTTQFRKDYKLAKKRKLDLSLLEAVLDTLCEEKPLDQKHQDHALTGKYSGHRECHIQPNWLLIYRVERENLILVAVSTGTHSDLF